MSFMQTTGMRMRQLSLFAVIAALASNLAGCAAVKGIFKAGVWLGILAALVIVGVGALAIRAVKS
jgi:hypothetical protein